MAEHDNGAVGRKARKTKAAVKADPLAAENALLKQQNAELTQQVKALSENVAALQASLRASRIENSETDSVEFDPLDCPSSTQTTRRGPPGLFVRHPNNRSGREDHGQEVTRLLSSVTLGGINISECRPSEGDEIGRRDLELWLDVLVSHLKLAGIEDEATKLAIFKVKAGSALMDIYHSTKSGQDAPDEAEFPFSNAIHRLRMHFRSSSDVMLQRRRLALLSQEEDETDMSYVTRAAKVAKLCIIAGAIAGQGRTKELRVVAMTLLREINDVNEWNNFNNVKRKQLCYQDLIDRVRGLEAITLNEKHYKENHNRKEEASVAAVAEGNAVQPFRKPQFRDFRPQLGRSPGNNRISSRYQPYRRSENYRGPGYRVPASSFPSSGRTRGAGFYQQQEHTPRSDRCPRCHSIYHKEEECPALDKICMKCGVRGHLARACPPTQRQQNQRRESSGTVNAVADYPALMDVETETKEAGNVG